MSDCRHENARRDEYRQGVRGECIQAKWTCLDCGARIEMTGEQLRAMGYGHRLPRWPGSEQPESAPT